MRTGASDRHPSGNRLQSRAGGFALVLVLWIVSLLSIMAGSFALTMRRESTVVSINKENAEALAVAEAGIAAAEMMLLNPDQIRRWRTDGNVYEIGFGDTKARIRLISEMGKIDMNKADAKLLEAVFAQAPLDEERQKKLIGAILDWRDPDDLLSLEGAEKKEYKDAGLKYHPRNKPFQSMEELQMVLGMDENVYNWLEPMVTVYSGQAQVNLKVATLKVLKLMPNLDADLLENFITSRLDSNRNNMPAPEFQGAPLGSAAANGGGREAITIVSEALLPNEARAMVSATVVKATDAFTQGTSFKTLRWLRNPGNVPSLFNAEMDSILVKHYDEPELSH
jgi:general secretion pathway protein K